MILTGAAIASGVALGDICLDPFDPALINPNSYNYRLGSTLKTMAGDVIADSRSKAVWDEFEIPAAGFVLQPRRLYLGTTLERIGSSEYVPTLIGRSSVGRLGLFLQISADLGQMGAEHNWTLELTAVQAIRVYPGMVIGQVSFWKPIGDKIAYRGYYGTRSEPTPWNPVAAHGIRLEHS